MQSRNNEVEIIILKQIHRSDHLLNNVLHAIKTGNDLLPADEITLNALIESQYQVIDYIIKNPDVPVILENHAATTSNPSRLQAARILFPHGLPERSELTLQQKSFFVMYSGVELLYDLKGKTTNADNMDAKPFLQQMGPVVKKMTDADKNKLEAKIMLTREYLALTNAYEVAKRSKSKRAILIYGGAHNFEPVKNACFPQVSLKIVNTFDAQNLKSNKKEYMDYIKKVETERPAIDCEQLALGFKDHGYFVSRHNYAYESQRIAQMQTAAKEISLQPAAYNNYEFVAGVLACGILAFSLFKCCKGKNKSKTENAATSKKFKND